MAEGTTRLRRALRAGDALAGARLYRQAARGDDADLMAWVLSTAHEQRGSRGLGAALGWCPEMVWVPGGRFEMGRGRGAPDDEQPRHEVRVGGVWLSETAVTQRQWFAVMGYRPSKVLGGEVPVHRVSWHEAVM